MIGGMMGTIGGIQAGATTTTIAAVRQAGKFKAGAVVDVSELATETYVHAPSRAGRMWRRFAVALGVLTLAAVVLGALAAIAAAVYAYFGEVAAGVVFLGEVIVVTAVLYAVMAENFGP